MTVGWLYTLLACEPDHPPLIHDASATCVGDTWALRAYVTDRDGYDDVAEVTVSFDEGEPFMLAYERDGAWRLDAAAADLGAACDPRPSVLFEAVDRGGLVDALDR